MAKAKTVWIWRNRRFGSKEELLAHLHERAKESVKEVPSPPVEEVSEGSTVALGEGQDPNRAWGLAAAETVCGQSREAATDEGCSERPAPTAEPGRGRGRNTEIFRLTLLPENSPRNSFSAAWGRD